MATCILAGQEHRELDDRRSRDLASSRISERNDFPRRRPGLEAHRHLDSRSFTLTGMISDDETDIGDTDAKLKMKVNDVSTSMKQHTEDPLANNRSMVNFCVHGLDGANSVGIFGLEPTNRVSRSQSMGEMTPLAVSESHSPEDEAQGHDEGDKKSRTCRLAVTAVHASVAERVCSKPKEVNMTMGGGMATSAKELKKTSAFKFAGMLDVKLEVKPMTEHANPFTMEPLVCKTRPLSLLMESARHVMRGNDQLRVPT